MAGLLSADAIAVLRHVFIDKAVANGGFLITDAHFVERLIQTEIAHHGGDDLVARQLAFPLHLTAEDVDDLIPIHNLAVFIYRQTAIRVAVVGKADVQMVFHNKPPQPVDVRRACTAVDVHAVRLSVDDKGFRAQRFKNSFGDIPRAAVGAVRPTRIFL